MMYLKKGAVDLDNKNCVFTRNALFIRVGQKLNVINTDKTGSFEIKNIPAGKWVFQFWHKKARYMKELELAGRTFDRRGDTEIEIKDGVPLDLGTLKIPVEAFE